MSSATVRSGFDTWAGSAKSSMNRGGEKYLRLKSGEAEAFIYFKAPVPAGSTVSSAKLRFRARGASSGSRNVTAQRITQSWKEKGLTWDNRPSITATGAATKAVTTLADGDLIELDVTTIVQTFVTSGVNYGFKITTSGTTQHFVYGLNASAYKPTLEVTWTDAPAQPTNLRPSSGVIATAKPVLQFDYVDYSGNTDLASVQVQIDPAASTSAPAFDSGEVATTAAELDLTTTSYAGLANNATTKWRVRAKDGDGLWSLWSDWSSMTRTDKAAVTITNLSTGIFAEPTPPVLWTSSGQTAYRVFVAEASSPDKVLHDSGKKTGSTSAYTIPKGVLDEDGSAYTVTVRTWDNVANRVLTPGVPLYAETSATATLSNDGTVSPVASLSAQTYNLSPWVDLTWTRSTTADSWVLYADGKVAELIENTDLTNVGTSYTYRYRGAPPNKDVTYSVRAVVNSKQSAAGPTVTYAASPNGIWLVDGDRGISVTLWGDDEGTWDMPDDATVFAPVGSSKVVRIVHGMQGLSGSITGLLMEGWGKTFDQMLADIYSIKERPTETVRIVAGDVNFRALIGNLRVAPRPETRDGQQVRAVAFDFWQVDDLPFNPRV